MSTAWLLVTMISVFVGFLCILGAFASFMYKKPVALTWALGGAALVLVTVIPVTIAVFYAAGTNS
ncbi:MULTISPECIES: hypothetical protein [unclassified Corynebacterium]|uniref:hypothetical protein n=1 Tax=unclassified Corynebacterium TaxID=2624378 RepID=UPI0029CA3A3D|nr:MULTISPECIES: hypothetical protein [unclassified Corynebacterium]WPF66094.1 hypothetical protein OLX12_11190 [Corynebacterium sp. 22KM0430]WPF68586.1 hypothetical protein OLW90_11185 [Corynebacterium sp. 21KM1197]